MNCPRCKRELEISFCTGGRMLRCIGCGGTAVTVEMLRRFAPKERIDELWRQAVDARVPGTAVCTGCDGPLRSAAVKLNGAKLPLEVCTHCHLVWFDAHELRAFSPRNVEPSSAAEERAAAAERYGIQAGSVRSRDELWRVLVNLEGVFA